MKRTTATDSLRLFLIPSHPTKCHDADTQRPFSTALRHGSLAVGYGPYPNGLGNLGRGCCAGCDWLGPAAGGRFCWTQARTAAPRVANRSKLPDAGTRNRDDRSRPRQTAARLALRPRQVGPPDRRARDPSPTRQFCSAGLSAALGGVAVGRRYVDIGGLRLSLGGDAQPSGHQRVADR